MLGSPLFIVSGPELVIAQCKAGIVGSFPALNARPVEKLDEWLTHLRRSYTAARARAAAASARKSPGPLGGRGRASRRPEASDCIATGRK